MFTWQELLDMGLREKGYWLRQADAVRRQTIAMLAHGARLGMADEKGYQKGIDELELAITMDEVKKQESEATWGLMALFGKDCKGV